jgi:hypothetical protein
VIVMHQHGLSLIEQYPITTTWVAVVTYWVVLGMAGGGWPL